MKKLLFLILVLFTANVAFSQITTNVSLKCQIYASSGTAPTFNVQSIVSDELSKYDGSNVSAGDKLYVIEGSECYELHISSVSSGIGSTLNIVVYDSTGTLATVPNGQAAVIRKYSTQQVPFIPSGLRNDLASCILQKLASVIDNIGSDGNGIYSGSDTLSVGDTTVVTTLAGSALKVGNTIQSPSSITTINDVNHWGTYDGWDRLTYSYGGYSGYYFIRGNGTLASKTALSVNDVMHEWSFLGQKSPTEDNYALIMRPTVDEITGGNNWGRLDFQGADFQTWLSLRRTGIRAGTSANYTTFPALRPTGSASFWQHNTDGTAQYVTPGAMTVTNPYGGTNTLQATLDSINVAGGDGSITNEGFVGVTAGSGTSSVLQGYNSEGTATGAGTTINAGTGLSIAETTSTNGGQITLTNSAPDQTVSISGTGITVGGSYPSFTLTAADQSATNELQTISNTSNATTHTVTLSNSGGSVQLAEGANTTLTTTGNDLNGIVTIAVPVTNPAGGSNTLQATLDSISSTWLKPKLEAGDVTINSADNTLIINKASMTNDPAIHVVHPTPTVSVTKRLFSAGANSTSRAFEISQESNNAYKVSTERRYLNFVTVSEGVPTAALLGSGELYISNAAAPSALKLNGGSGTVSIAASPSNAENWTLTMPTTNGSSGQFLQTNGTGVASWESVVIPTTTTMSLYKQAVTSYTAQPLGDPQTNISIPNSNVVGLGLAQVVAGSGNGIQASFGATQVLTITASVSVSTTTGEEFYLQILIDGNPVGGGDVGLYQAATVGANQKQNMSMTINWPVDSSSVITMSVAASGSGLCTLYSPILTVQKL